MSDDADADADETDEHVTADDFLESDDVEQLRGSPNHSRAAVSVLEDFAPRFRDADGVEQVELTAAVTDALQTLAEESDDPASVRDRAKSKAGPLAPKAGTGKDELIGIVDDATRSIIEADRKERIETGDVLTVSEGIGLDRYLEEYLDEIVRQKSTDAVDDPIFRWRFSDGVRIETSESIHHDYYALFKKLAGATDLQLVPELASEEAEDELLEDEDVDGDAYARLSLGAESRPWHRDGDLWSRAISGLVGERIRTESVVGPRTDAWESIKMSVRSGRAVRDLTDAVEHGMIHVDDERGEVWLPTTIIDNAADQIETSRRAIQAELSERGVTSSELSGARVSEAVSRGGSALRFWRLDLDHEDVPTPETVLDEVADPAEIDISGDADDAAAAAATTDGGTETERGAETFGRSPGRADRERDDDHDEREGDPEPDGTDSEGESDDPDDADAEETDHSEAGEDDDPDDDSESSDGGESE